MTLDYIHKNDIAEKYLLGQLTTEEKFAYEAFLEGNEQARLELQEKKTLIAAIRAVGTDSMHKEIAHQVEALRSPKTDWTLLYKAAAILFVFVLVPSAVYFQLFNIPEQKPFTEKNISEVAKDDMEVISEKSEEKTNDEVVTKNTPSPVQRSKSAKKQNSPNPAIEGIVKETPEQIKSEKEKDVRSNRIDDLLTYGVSSGSSTKSAKIPLSKQQAVASSFDAVNLSKMYSYILDAKNVNISLFLSDSITGFPDSFPILVSKKNETNILLELHVSKEIYSLVYRDISPKWDGGKKLTITFQNKTNYEINFGSKKTVAKKVSKQD